MAYLVLLTLILAPTYAIRFSLLGLPTNFLMLWVFAAWVVFFVWLIIKKQFADFFASIKNINKWVLIFTALFFVSGIIGLFAKGVDREKTGQFIVLFLQPISLFYIGRFLFEKYPSAKNVLRVTCYVLLALAGLYAVLQYFTLIGLPQAWWGNSVEPKRALSFFEHPNFYALWAAPLLAFLVPDVFESLKSKIINQKSVLWAVGAIGLLLSLSRAGWLGLAAAIAVYLIFAADKKIRRLALAAAAVLIIVVAAVPNLRWRVLLPLYGEKSAVSRFSLWDTGLKAIKESPITGIGLTGFSRQWTTLNTDPNLDTHNYPHNIFLDFWVETGLLGLISFIGIAFIFIYNGLKNRQNLIKLSVALFVIAIIFSGLVDNPYFKNDLAMVFWIILASG